MYTHLLIFAKRNKDKPKTDENGCPPRKQYRDIERRILTTEYIFSQF